MDNFMKRAVELAIENVRDGGQPFGAVLIKNEEVLGEGVNELHMKYDISGHAELLAIRRAQEYLQTNDLSGTTMYASGFPCPMCFAAMHFAGVERIYYCASLEEAKSVGLGKSAVIYEDLQKETEERVLPMVRMELQEEIENPMNLWREFNKKGML
ncbi:nucleoside deaminase [Psychrobacillus lasiicapitis]|uniref:Nucleoside deaminase n=1 Tax=Psychrobacillus lasiicapitis TaxID=1636719 RepID=A0A544T315_9BACI|nr:nucleoside deaminase [Psychrobacillus lasiicapitis]TQR11804.1 nucleoside deaminase [Psychrobacillus lasiicapitis]GGA19548.1 tRNA-specific adenosine deaminase [Psychrobacillus lasiicapitis]